MLKENVKLKQERQNVMIVFIEIQKESKTLTEERQNVMKVNLKMLKGNVKLTQERQNVMIVLIEILRGGRTLTEEKPNEQIIIIGIQNKNLTQVQRRESVRTVDIKFQKKNRETPSKKRRRQDSDYRESEKHNDSVAKQIRRTYKQYKSKEAGQSSQYRHRKKEMTVQERIEHFHNLVKQSPFYICTSCQQLCYRHSVNVYKHKTSVKFNIPEIVSIDKKVWICTTCKSYINKNKIPPMSTMNSMGFPAQGLLSDLNTLEQNLLAVRLPFMKIHEAPRRRQKFIRGNMVLVPADVHNTVSQLPRFTSNTSTIRAKLKRKLKYKHHVYNCQTTNNPSMNEDDKWSEIDENELMSGMCDTMLSSKDFLEPDERDFVYYFAPGEGGAPVSVFLEKESEELAFPSIFCGERRPNNDERPVNVTYGEIVKSELRNVDRRTACSIENIFFKAKKIQMKILIDQTNILIRKVKTGHETLTVKDIKDEDSTSKHLVELQIQRHSHTCQMKKNKRCRFGFPRPILDKTVILEPLSSSEFTKEEIVYKGVDITAPEPQKQY
ncbi:hypothetical protein MAR_029976 [Mya arenaria]|uniref:DUF6570 domain-containing protein n=1 Tax=Mya arenaria TaxID=6604 RepID=A0ABY7DK24_MYAAR|nr:hypothetical protein MAR_029976 [Mya arenaria]